MNAKTAKIINRYARVMGKIPRLCKRAWNRTPANQRATLRKELERFIV